MNSKCKGIILRTTKYSEADLILQVLSNHGEKISMIAKGALRSKKRFGGGVLQPTHFVEFTFKRHQNGDRLSVIEEAVLLNGFEKIRTDYDRMEVAFFILECLSKVSQEGDALSTGLFDLAGNAFKALENAKNVDLVKLHFGLKLLYQQGVLEPETWMKDCLSTPLVEHEKLNSIEILPNRQHLIWLENKVHEYLKTGSSGI